MLHFESDYNNGAQEAVLRHLLETNDERTQSYGDDRFSEHARALIREAAGTPDAYIYFLAGGTQTNATILDCILEPFEGVLCCDTAHINVHESGAVEATGHKVIAIPNVPTELGTLYSLDELKALREVCDDYNLKLYVDGARLCYGLAASHDVTLPQLAALTDAFYIGGTKCGALCGEAVVFPRGDAPSHMLSRIKRHGALLAKSRVVGVQFEALFTDGLYFQIGQQAVRLAQRLRDFFVNGKGYRPFIDSPTNQQFFIVPNADLDALRRVAGFENWCPVDADHTAVRFVTSWATREEEVEELMRLLSL